jgi:hypothetical protein
MLAAAATLSILGFFEPTLRLRDSGRQIALHGTGPPVVFSSGLFGLMPQRIYTKLFREMEDRVTLVVLRDPAPVTRDVVEEIADTLAVDKVGFFAHSSFDAQILDSSRLGAAVLCDPVTLPRLELPLADLDLRAAFRSSSVEGGDAGVLLIRAGLAYEEGASSPPIPEYLAPRVDAARATEVTLDGVGHADLLDDTWADLGARALPWMQGATQPSRAFREWTYDRGGGALGQTRADYRRRVAGLALAHILPDEEGDAGGLCEEEAEAAGALAAASPAADAACADDLDEAAAA